MATWRKKQRDRRIKGGKRNDGRGRLGFGKWGKKRGGWRWERRVRKESVIQVRSSDDGMKRVKDGEMNGRNLNGKDMGIKESEK